MTSKKPCFSFFCLFVASLILPAAFFGGCGKTKPQNEILESYRILINGKPYTFNQQMLYLISALEIYHLHIGAYPSVQNNLEALAAKPTISDGTGQWLGPYVEEPQLLLDPWKRRLAYSLDEKGIMDLRSLGADGIRSEDDLTAQTMFPDWYREAKNGFKDRTFPIHKK